MLRLLANSGGEPVSRETLAGEGGANNERTVDVQINRLRRKIETDPAESAASADRARRRLPPDARPMRARTQTGGAR